MYEAHGEVCGPCADYKTIAAGNWNKVCAEINSDYQTTNNTNLTFTDAKIRLNNGNFQNQGGSNLSGNLIAVWVENGNFENDGTWTATVENYCTSGSVTVPTAYLPSSQSCETINSYFSPCVCSGN